MATLEIPSWAFTYSACHQGCTGSASLQVTPGHHFLCRSRQILIMSMAIMLTACRASQAWWELALQVLQLIQSPRCSRSHVWKHTCSLLGSTPAPRENLQGWAPFAVRRENPHHLPRMGSLFFRFLRVSVQSEAEHRRNADGPVARREPTPEGAAQPFPRSYGLAAVVKSPVGSSLAYSC